MIKNRTDALIFLCDDVKNHESLWRSQRRGQEIPEVYLDRKDYLATGRDGPKSLSMSPSLAWSHFGPSERSIPSEINSKKATH